MTSGSYDANDYAPYGEKTATHVVARFGASGLDLPPAPPTTGVFTWADFPAGYTWADFPAGLTWGELDSLDDLEA